MAYESTDTPGLYKRKGIYWYRLQVNGKRVFRSLKTENKADAQFLVGQKRKELAAPPPEVKWITFGDYAAQLETQYAADLSIGEREKSYVNERLGCAEKTWPGIMAHSVKTLTEQGIRHWAAELAKTRKPSTVRGTLIFLRKTLELAVDAGAIAKNPAWKVKAPGVSRRPAVYDESGGKHEVSREKFALLLAEMRKGNGMSRPLADFAELLALTGLRLKEARTLTWDWGDWENKRLRAPTAKGRVATGEQGRTKRLPFYLSLHSVLISLLSITDVFFVDGPIIQDLQRK